MIKKFTSVLLVFLLSILLLQRPAIYAASTVESNQDIAWEYTIMDEDGTIEETGIIPARNPLSRYSWPGVTLANKQSATFKPTRANENKNGLYCLKGIPMTVKYTLNKDAYAEMRIYRYDTSISTAASWLQKPKAFSQTYRAATSSYYYLKLTNYSSDPITVKSISLSF